LVASKKVVFELVVQLIETCVVGKDGEYVYLYRSLPS